MVLKIFINYFKSVSYLRTKNNVDFYTNNNYDFFFSWDYSYILFFFLISFFFTLFLGSLSYLLAPKTLCKEKNTSYECGFIPLDDIRGQFDINFFLVGLLFVIFDLELVFLFPWALCLQFIGKFGFFTMYFFLIILFFGFWYEWGLGAISFSVKKIIYNKLNYKKNLFNNSLKKNTQVINNLLNTILIVVILLILSLISVSLLMFILTLYF